MCTISVIVLVYKVEVYLPRCIDSVLHQTFADLELILVDDGSPDNCGKICDEYAQKDARVRVLHQENAGLSQARNAGLDIAAGAYIAFLDSDDYAQPDMLEKLYQALVAADADMSICNFRMVGDIGHEEGTFDNSDLPIKQEVLSAKEILTHRMHTPKGWYWVVAWNKLYKRRLFDHFRYPVGHWSEDVYAIHHILLQCERVACISDMLINYVKRTQSITGQKLTVKHMDVIYAYLDRAECLIQAGYDKVTIYGYLVAAMVFMGPYYKEFWGQPDFMERHHAYHKKFRELAKQLPAGQLSAKENLNLLLNRISPRLAFWVRKNILKK